MMWKKYVSHISQMNKCFAKIFFTFESLRETYNLFSLSVRLRKFGFDYLSPQTMWISLLSSFESASFVVRKKSQTWFIVKTIHNKTQPKWINDRNKQIFDLLSITKVILVLKQKFHELFVEFQIFRFSFVLFFIFGE